MEHSEDPPPPGNSRGRLPSPAELRILRLIASGLIQKEAAARLDISLRTVQAHLQHLRNAHGTNTTKSLIAMAHRNSWFSKTT